MDFATFPWVEVVAAVLVIASAIVAATPTEKDDDVLARIKNVFSKLRGK